MSFDSTSIATVGETSHALTWATKTGTARVAHGEVGKAQAPRAVRMSAAHAAAVAQLVAGVYRPTLRDAVDSLKGPTLAGLRAYVAGRLATVVDGVSMAPSGDVLVANKRVMLAVAEWAMNPVSHKVVKGVDVFAPVTFTKATAEKFAPITEWANIETMRIAATAEATATATAE